MYREIKRVYVELMKVLVFRSIFEAVRSRSLMRNYVLKKYKTISRECIINSCYKDLVAIKDTQFAFIFNPLVQRE